VIFVKRHFSIVDLFAGPGGLGEGFSSCGREGPARMSIHLSVEMDDHAVRTLRLRAFLRQFEQRFPQAYYDALNLGKQLPNWSDRYPTEWHRAETEARQLVLGAPGVFEHLSAELDALRDQTHGDTILIGGPPCQAYSLVGRSRNRGKTGYVAEDDHRHFLYREYVRILDRLRPAAFVMENVKGILSSRVGGDVILGRIMEDLETAGDGYSLLPLSAPPAAWSPGLRASNFLVRAEEHGIPQARHRIFIVGIRNDVMPGGFVSEGRPLLDRALPATTVSMAISGLARLRSGLSTSDTSSAWRRTVVEQATRISIDDTVEPDLRDAAARTAREEDLPTDRSARELIVGANTMPDHLRRWLIDPRLEVATHHETRGHIPGDLGRYLFASLFAASGRGRSPTLSEFPDFLQPDC
jgi:DNA (cytosine-5)-methyltransferase 1